MRRQLKRYVMHPVTAAVLPALIVAITLSACATGANLSPRGQILFQLNEAVIAVGTIQSTAITLNATAGPCAPPTVTTPPVCPPILSDANTRLVVTTVSDLLTTLRSVPSGSKATILKALDVIDARLDAAGRERLRVYVSAARTIALGLLGTS